MSPEAAASHPARTQFTCVPPSTLNAIPPEVIGKSFKLGELAKQIDKRGIEYVTRRTLYNWATQGLPDRDGKPVILKTSRNGRCYQSTIIWVCEFKEATNVSQPASPAPRSGTE